MEGGGPYRFDFSKGECHPDAAMRPKGEGQHVLWPGRGLKPPCAEYRWQNISSTDLSIPATRCRPNLGQLTLFHQIALALKALNVSSPLGLEILFHELRVHMLGDLTTCVPIPPF